ncbi:flagellar export protein FliJ [Celerinatantimonas sp. YJH-8]|uniref:flagellar export protein FliJ n=1 Tax=Celerinatantimonas sp. YJH-8 TaxID=3228714 RepID=UPI0038CAD78D
MAQQALTILLEQLQTQEQRATVELTQARHQLLLFQQQLRQLEDYRRSYMEQSLARGASGVTASGFHQYQAFIQTIEKAESEQQKSVQQLQANVAHKRQQWQAIQNRRKAIEQLIERQNQQLQKKAQRAEQKMSDEFAMMSFYRRQQQSV